MAHDDVASEPAAEMATDIWVLLLTGMAFAGLLRLLGSAAWALVALLVIAAIPLLRRGWR